MTLSQHAHNQVFRLLTALLAAAILIGALFWTSKVDSSPAHWRAEWPNTDFSIHSVDLSEIFSGGPPRDGIPSIDNPQFVPAAEIAMSDMEPVMGLIIGDTARAYPLRILMWHEIVNDEVEGQPLAITYCPLCNTGLVFERQIAGQTLSFGTTGKLRRSDLVMYDRESESWWQQFTGEAIVGGMTGEKLKTVPARLESFANFKQRAPAGEVLVPNDASMRAYGRNPYDRYDSRTRPYGFFQGELPTDIAPLARVVRVGDQVWALDYLQKQGEITQDNFRLSFEKGQSSALDSAIIADGRDVGNVVVQERTADGDWQDVAYSVDFAFAVRAFMPEAKIHGLN